MLKVAVPNKGVLSEAAISMLSEAGYATRRDTKELHLLDEQNQVEFFYLRPKDIATYVGKGTLDAGITGLDLMLDGYSEAEIVEDLEFGASALSLAAPNGSGKTISDFNGKRIATAYSTLTRDLLAKNGVQAELVKLDGAVENAVILGVADAVVDVVSTGNTLRRAGLEIIGEPLMRSTAQLISSPGKSHLANGLLRRLQGVLVARKYVIFDFDCPLALLEKASEITPGFESPTVSPLQDKDWVAVRALVLAAETNQKLDELQNLGAKAILVSEIHAARI
ncbi:MAG TPA: ATP phosphoribosyltransferase [Microbacteriaceae bacterium]